MIPYSQYYGGTQSPFSQMYGYGYRPQNLPGMRPQGSPQLNYNTAINPTPNIGGPAYWHNSMMRYGQYGMRPMGAYRPGRGLAIKPPLNGGELPQNYAMPWMQYHPMQPQAQPASYSSGMAYLR